MGNARRLRKSLNRPKIAMADAHIDINGCRVFIGHPDGDKASLVAKGFKGMMTTVIGRAQVPNMKDFYRAHFANLEKLKGGIKV